MVYVVSFAGLGTALAYLIGIVFFAEAIKTVVEWFLTHPHYAKFIIYLLLSYVLIIAAEIKTDEKENRHNQLVRRKSWQKLSIIILAVIAAALFEIKGNFIGPLQSDKIMTVVLISALLSLLFISYNTNFINPKLTMLDRISDFILKIFYYSSGFASLGGFLFLYGKLIYHFIYLNNASTAAIIFYYILTSLIALIYLAIHKAVIFSKEKKQFKTALGDLLSYLLMTSVFSLPSAYKIYHMGIYSIGFETVLLAALGCFTILHLITFPSSMTRRKEVKA